jgi:selenium metabolism protein YedF
MRIVDTKGQLCPAPIIAAKRALREVNENETFMILTDNKTSFENLSRFLKDNKAAFTVTESGGVWSFSVTRSGIVTDDIKAEDYCDTTVPHFHKGNFMVVISSDKMGDGDSALGHILMASFLKALKDLTDLPERIAFYNSGVKLMTKTSPVVDHLLDLEKMGVELILCGTCVNHYSLADEIASGTISNMYAIAELMSSAGKILKP